MEIPVQLLWDAHNVEHIASHNVSTTEVEEVVADPASLWERDDSHRAGRLTIRGLTGTDRPLVIVTEPLSPNQTTYPVSARPMTRREQRVFFQERSNP